MGKEKKRPDEKYSEKPWNGTNSWGRHDELQTILPILKSTNKTKKGKEKKRMHNEPKRKKSQLGGGTRGARTK